VGFYGEHDLGVDHAGPFYRRRSIVGGPHLLVQRQRCGYSRAGGSAHRRSPRRGPRGASSCGPHNASHFGARNISDGRRAGGDAYARGACEHSWLGHPNRRHNPADLHRRSEWRDWGRRYRSRYAVPHIWIRRQRNELQPVTPQRELPYVTVSVRYGAGVSSETYIAAKGCACAKFL